MAVLDVNKEIERTKQVIADRQSKGQELTSQMAHYKNLTGQNYTVPKAVNTAAQTTGASQPNADQSIEDMFGQSQTYLNNMFNQQQASQLAALRAQRDQAVGNINQQKAKVAPQFQNLRNQQDVVNHQNVQKLREMMAANGLNATGENVSATAAMNNERVNSLNKLNLQERDELSNYDRQITDLMNPAQEQQLIAALESQRAQALYDSYNRAQDVGYSRYRDTVADSRYADETAYNRGRDTIGDQRYNQEWNYNVGRDKVADSRYNTEWNYNVGRDKVADSQWQKQFDEDTRRFGLNYAMDKQREARMASSGGSSGGGSTGGNGFIPGDTSPKSKDQSYYDLIQLFLPDAEKIAQKGLPNAEETFLKSSQAKELAKYGYNLDAAVDALYAATTSGRFKSKKEYTTYLQEQEKLGHSYGGRVPQ